MKNKNTLLSFVAGLLFVGFTSTISSCGKDEPDPRDEFIGSFDIEYNCVGTSFGDVGTPYGYDYFFVVEKADFPDNGLIFSGMPSGEATVILSGNDFVGDLGSSLSGTFISNRIVINSFGFHPGKNCSEDLPVTAYKR
jgi:hypothetical protein